MTCHLRKKLVNETITTKMVCLGISQQHSGLKKSNRNNFDNNNNNNDNNNNKNNNNDNLIVLGMTENCIRLWSFDVGE